MSIHIEDLTVRFKNGVTAIDHADLDIPNGIFGLLGENGAGKTTLMRVLTTVLKPVSGTVTLDGILYSEGNYEKIGVSLAEDYPHVFMGVFEGSEILTGGNCKMEGSIIVFFINILMMVGLLIYYRRSA